MRQIPSHWPTAVAGVSEFRCTPRFGRPRGGRYAPWPLDDDISPCAGDYRLELCLLSLGHSKLVKCLLEIVEKGVPLSRCDHQKLMRVLHGAARVRLRPAGSPADHFRDEVLEACRGNAMMGFVYPWVRIQAGINHDPVDEVIHHGGASKTR
jgi:hypothetical protein